MIANAINTISMFKCEIRAIEELKKEKQRNIELASIGSILGHKNVPYYDGEDIEFKHPRFMSDLSPDEQKIFNSIILRT